MRSVLMITVGIVAGAVIQSGVDARRAKPLPTPTPIELRDSRPLPEPVTYNVSAYCAGPCCCGDFADGITASGHKIQPGDCFVAAPKSIPFGTKLWIPGYNGGEAVSVLDRGGAIKGNKLDVFFGGKDGHQKALQWGRQYLKVKIEK